MDYKIDIVKAKHECIKWIQDWFHKNATSDSKAVIGISGGKDSTVAAKLCVEALGKKRVIGIMMPNISAGLLASSQNSIDALLFENTSKKSLSENIENIDKYVSALAALNDGYKVCKYLDIEHHVVNINEAYGSILCRIAHIPNDESIKNSISEQTKINLAPRLRMSVLYAISQSMNGRVVNTSNASELYVGYGTRWGDTVGDFAPLANLTCSEVKQLGYSLGLPSFLVNRTPDDGLCGKSDEESFGFTYAELDNYIRNKEPFSKALHIDEMHNLSEFKRKPIVSFVPSI